MTDNALQRVEPTDWTKLVSGETELSALVDVPPIVDPTELTVIADARTQTRVQYYQAGFQCSGSKGQTITVTNQILNLFRPEKLFAIDDFTRNGYGTVIRSIWVGAQNQFLNNIKVGTWCFGTQALGNDIKIDAVRPGLNITFQIEFLESCNWYASLFGKVIV